MAKKRHVPFTGTGQGDARPLVAVVGRPNVGKSTLFNRLVGKPIAIVEDVAGVTRDRHYAVSEVLGRPFLLVDTGGFDPDSDDPMAESIASQVYLALEECDVVICVVDGTAEPTPADREAIALLRRTDKPVLYVANKADSPDKADLCVVYYELGIEKIFPVSALHGRGVAQFEDALLETLPKQSPSESDEESDAPRIAIIGRPNAGKSSLVNHITRSDRLLVDDRPGTTMDSIDTRIEHKGAPMVIIDTAGMRRKRSVKGGIEGLGVLQAIRAMERSHAVILMIDARRGVAEQDAKIAGLAVDRGRALVLALNKMDLLSQDERKEAQERARDVLSFAPWAPMVTLSVKEGRGIHKLLDRVLEVVAQHNKRISTGELNRFFEHSVETHPPPIHKGKAPRFYFVTQAQVRPPTFVMMTNHPEAIHWSYQRYIVNSLRKQFGFEGTPIRVRYRARRRRP